RLIKGSPASAFVECFVLPIRHLRHGRKGAAYRLAQYLWRQTFSEAVDGFVKLKFGEVADRQDEIRMRHLKLIVVVALDLAAHDAFGADGKQPCEIVALHMK